MHAMMLAAAMAVSGAQAPADDEPTYTVVVQVDGI